MVYCSIFPSLSSSLSLSLTFHTPRWAMNANYAFYVCILLYFSISLTSLYHTPPQMGYDALFFARNDYDDKNQRLKDNSMEFIWRSSMSLGDESDIFTGIFLFHYGPPPGFCFDVKCTDPPIQVQYNRIMWECIK